MEAVNSSETRVDVTELHGVTTRKMILFTVAAAARLNSNKGKFKI
jgi:hypothetical protein